MVSSSYLGGLVSRAIFLISTHVTHKERAGYVQDGHDAIEALQTWYNGTTGLWDSTGWWNGANCLTVLAEYALLDPEGARQLDLPTSIQNTYEQAQKTPVQAVKMLSLAGLPTSSYSRGEAPAIGKRGFDNFLNDYYDDEGWWALALIRSHDLGVLGLGDQEYIQAAEEIFEDMRAGRSKCGGIHWSKVSDYTNAIANELFLSVGAFLANRLEGKKQYYTQIARAQWDWFRASGMINKDNLINDGLTGDCKNNGMQTWSYNQGVVLGGLVELWRATGDDSLLDEAHAIAVAAITHLSRDGVLFEGCEPNCGDDGAQFKGVFLRNLKYLQEVHPYPPIKDFILRNADAIWAHDRSPDGANRLGIAWNGPYAPATAGTHSSALDTIIAAIAVV